MIKLKSKRQKKGSTKTLLLVVAFAVFVVGFYVVARRNIQTVENAAAVSKVIPTTTSENLYVTDINNNKVSKVNFSGTFFSQWGGLGTGISQMNSPYGITVDSLGNTYVSDGINKRIQKFNSVGSFVSQWSTGGQYNTPWGIAADRRNANVLYVVLGPVNKIQKYSSSGTLITSWGLYGTTDGNFNSPYGVATDTLGNVYVTERGNSRVQKFSPGGAFISKWGTAGSGDGQFNNPNAIAIDSLNNIYVLDSDNFRIQKFSSNGVFLSKWGTMGTSDGQFLNPDGIAVDAQNNVYVTDASNFRIQKFSSNGAFISKWVNTGTSNQTIHPFGIAFGPSASANTLIPPVKPDLVVNSLTFNSSTLHQSTTPAVIQFSTTIANVGPTGPSGLALPAGTSFTLYSVPANVAIGQAVSVPNTLPYSGMVLQGTTNLGANARAVLGTFGVKLVADSTNVISESIETNNSYIGSFTIIP